MCQQLGTRLSVIDHEVQQDPLLEFAFAGISETGKVSLLHLYSCLNENSYLWDDIYHIK